MSGQEKKSDPKIPNLINKTILVVEDEYVNYKLLELLLRKTKCSILYAENGEEAVDMVKEQKIDLIIMDLKMPVMDGYEATAEITKLSLNIPIIALTAHSVIGEKEKCIEAGCSGFILKPVDSGELYMVLSEHI